MTQSSRPQQDNQSNGYLDAGPYSRDQWASKLISEWVGDAVTTKGPFAKVQNRLEVTNPAGVNIQVDTGAGYCGGSYFESDTTVTFSASLPAVNPRYDVVVIVLNNTNVAYSTNLHFPTVLTDYTGSAVPAYSARLAVLEGVEGAGVPRALVQTTNYYMVPLAEFVIDAVPTITSVTDERDYVDAEDKVLWVPISGGVRGATDLLPTVVTFLAVLELQDAVVSTAVSRTIIPNDYICDMTVKGVVRNNGNPGDIYARLDWRAGACAEVYNAHNGSSGYAAETIAATMSYNSCHRQTAITGVTGGDILDLLFYRDATDVLDTINAALPFIGFIVEYVGFAVSYG